MMAVELEVLPFRQPRWFRDVCYRKRRSARHCFFDYISEEEAVERDFLFLDNPQAVRPEELEMMKDKEIRMLEKYYIPQAEEDAKRKSKRKSKRKIKRKRKSRSEKKEAEEEEEEEEADRMEAEEHDSFPDMFQLMNPIPPWTIKKGLIFDIRHLLSSPSGKRDYLIKFKGNEKVKIDQLSGKYVLLYFWFLSKDKDGLKPHEIDSVLNADLEEIYKSSNTRGQFEVVFVALGTNKDAFQDSFSRMPWLAIPHEDQESRDFIKTELSIPYSALVETALFAPDGTVLLENTSFAFRAYGAEGFPFTKQRMEDIDKRELCKADALRYEFVYKRQKPSLTVLLGDYLVNSAGDQVSTSKLEGKTVGLFFFNLTTLGFRLARKLLKLWRSLEEGQRNNFEIVFINEGSIDLSHAKAEFENKYRSTIPWYSLPFDGRRLCQVFKLNRYDYRDNAAGYFIILEPDKYQPLSYFAFDILEKFGIDAYPFTLERAVMIEKSKQQKKLVLGRLLSPSAPLRRGGSTSYKADTTVSKILGNCVLLLFATHLCYGSGLFLPALKRMYLKKKGTSDDFEIIYISLDCDEPTSSFPKSIREMPWLVHSSVPDFAVSLSQKVFEFPPRLPAIAAFGRDGHLETKESNLAFKKKWNSKYPFIQADMGEEVRRELISMHKWDLESLFPDISSKK